MFRFGDPGGAIYTSVGTSSVNFLAHWTGLSSNSCVSVQAGVSPSGGPALRFAGGIGYATRAIDNQPTWGLAFRVRLTGGLPTSNGFVMAAMLDAGTAQVDLRANVDGSVSVTRNGTTLGTSPPGVLATSAWAHLEFLATIDPSAGSYQVWRQGVSVLSGTGANTRATANSYAGSLAVGYVSNIGLLGGAGGNIVDICDIVVYDGQPTDAAGNADIHSQIGDCGLVWLLPTGAGTTAQWAPDSGANYARVNEATPDGDTSYVQDATVGDIDTYAMADLPAGTSSVKSVAAVQLARKTDAGARSIAAVVRTGGANHVHPTAIPMTGTYQYCFSNWGCDPATSAAWAVSAVNGVESGQKVAS